MTDGRVANVVGAVRPTPAVIAVYAISSVIGAFISLASANGSLAVDVVLTVVTTVLACALLAAARLLPWRALSSRPVALAALFLSVSIVVGAIRGLAFVELAQRWNVELVSGDVSQVANSVVSAVVWLSLAGLVIGSRDRYRGRYRALVLQGDADIDWDRHPGVEQVKETLGRVLDEGDESVGPDPLEVAEAIRREIDTNIRPLSHRLWFGTEEEEPRSRLLPLVRDALGAWTVPTRTVVVVWFLTALLGGVRWIGPERAIVAAIASSALLMVLLILIPRITAPLWWLRGIAVALGAVLVVIGSDAVTRLLGYESRLYDDVGLVVLIPLSIVALVLSGAAITLGEADRRTVLEVAQRESRDIAERRRQSAYLHNSLQSELTGMALQLDRAARSGSTEQAHAALERVHALLARSISEDFVNFQEAPKERIARVVAGWRGICQVSIALDDAAETDPRLGIAVQAIEEIISNSVRHGGATRIDFVVSLAAPGLTVVGESDGRPEAASATGLGSRVLGEIASGEVVLEAIDLGSRVELTIP